MRRNHSPEAASLYRAHFRPNGDLAGYLEKLCTIKRSGLLNKLGMRATTLTTSPFPILREVSPTIISWKLRPRYESQVLPLDNWLDIDIEAELLKLRINTTGSHLRASPFMRELGLTSMLLAGNEHLMVSVTIDPELHTFKEAEAGLRRVLDARPHVEGNRMVDPPRPGLLFERFERAD